MLHLVLHLMARTTTYVRTLDNIFSLFLRQHSLENEEKKTEFDESKHYSRTTVYVHSTIFFVFGREK